MKTLSLNGKWQLTYNDMGAPDRKWGRWIDAQVPGDVHLDLMRAGIIPEPLVEDNSQKQEWIEEKDWWYHKTFSAGRELQGARTELIFEGIDLTSDIWFNGVKLGSTNNMFREFRFDITNLISNGFNTLDIRLDVGLAAADDKPTEAFDKCWNTWDIRRFWIRKATQSFFWDITPRLHTCGLWRGVRIEAYDNVVIRDLYVSHTRSGSAADVTIEVELEAFRNAGRHVLTAQITDKNTRETASIDIDGLDAGARKAEVQLHLDDVKLWWPNGVGEPHLYQVEVILYQQGGGAVSSKSLRYGVREITIEQKELNPEESTFTFLVNGKRVYMKGGDWVPEDAIYARATPELTYQLVKLACDGNYNMFRVWGGGVYPSDAFFDACDEFGILVWEDFMFACGYYPDFDQEYYAEVEREVEYIVRKYRNHASLGLWSGNNENMQLHDETVAQFGDCTHHGLKIYEEIIPSALKKLDPDNFYWPSSPYGGKEANCSERGDQHIWDYSMAWLSNGTKQLEIWGFSEGNHKFVSEFGIETPPNMVSASKYMGHLPVDMTSHEWYHHMCYYAIGLIQNLLRRYYKDQEITDFREYTVAGQMIQAESVKDVLDVLRSRMYTCSGTLYWQYNESWGHTGYAPLDYYLVPKASYYYMKRAFAPVNAVFGDEWGKITVYNDTIRDIDATVVFGVKSFGGETLWSRTEEIRLVGSVPVLIDGMPEKKTFDAPACFAFVEVLETGKELSRNRKFLTDFKALQLPREEIAVSVSRIADCDWTIALSAQSFMWDVMILPEDFFTVSDNAFDIWPGEQVVLHVHTEEPVSDFHPEIISMNRYLGGVRHE